MKRTATREMIRQIIRESVRTRMGLLTEANENEDISFTTDSSVPSFTIANKSSKNIARLRIIKSSNFKAPIYDSGGTATLASGASWVYAQNSWSSLFQQMSGVASLIIQYNLEGDGYYKTMTVDIAGGVPTAATPSVPAAAETKPAAAEPAKTDSSAATASAATAVPAVPSEKAKSASPVQEPQAAMGDLQTRINQSAVAVSREFADRTYDGGADSAAVITLDDVKGTPGNSMSGAEWVDLAAGKDKYGLNNWSSDWSDKYTYFALVDTKTKKPIAFVVASDPMDDKHYSTGRFIGPESVRASLRKAFCVLYHRSTGEVHPTCDDMADKGPEDDRPKGSGGGRGGGKGKGGSGGGAEGKGEGPGAIRLVSKDGIAQRGRGDAMTGILGIGHRAGEKLRGAGRKIVTKSKSNRGFSGFPAGPDEKFLRNPLFAGGGKIPPSALGVFFQHPMAIIVDAKGMNPYINFGDNKSAENITLIRIGWGAVGRLGPRGTLTGGVTVKPGDKGFAEAAQWILANQKEFDLRPDGFVIEDPIDTGPTSDVKNKGGTTASSLEERRLFDRYRF